MRADNEESTRHPGRAWTEAWEETFTPPPRRQVVLTMAGVMLANAFIAIGDLFPPEDRGKHQGVLGVRIAISEALLLAADGKEPEVDIVLKVRPRNGNA